MEPIINDDLSGDVDLTLAAFTDLGWLASLPTGAKDGTPVATGVSGLSSYPNPFNPTTTIEYNVSTGQSIRLEVFDVRGKRVRTLASGWVTAGLHEVEWDGRDERGRAVASGVYYTRLAGELNTVTRKIVLLK
jgi:hypothetical protein